MARQGGVNSRMGEFSGNRSLRPSSMDQNVNESVDNGLQNRRHMVLSWQPGVDEESPSSVENIAVGDLVYPSTDASLPTFQKFRSGATHLADLSPFSEDEDTLDPTQDGSPVSHSRRRKHAGYSVAHINVSTNVNDATPDEISTHSEDYSFYRVKLLCSYAGKILPRPTDNQLRYVGGDTRLITVSRDIHYNELLQKMAELYAQAHTIKYKLPEEDLDALVSVSSDEDVANMMEEFDRLQSSEASTRLRLFLFSDVDHESVHLNESLGDQRSTEQRYVDAVNGISEPGSRKSLGDGGSVAIAPIIIDSLTDVGDSWDFNRHQDTVPVAMLAPQISQDVASLIQHVPVALPVSSVLPMSAPSSAPSSPPLLPRVLNQVFIPEMRLSDVHPLTYGHQYNIVQADGVVLEGDNFGVNLAISANVHEPLYNNSDLQRGSESPKKLQPEIDLLSGHQEVIARDDVRRLPEVRMPRVPSHGKLSRLSDHHSEATPSPRQRHGYQKPQQPQQQGCWPPHSFEDQTHKFSRRVELMQPASDVIAQPIAPGQQPESPHFRVSFEDVMPTPTIDQPIYRPADHHSLGEEVFAPFMQRSTSADTMGPIGAAAGSSYNVAAGSAPSSPRMTFRDPSNMRTTELPQLQLQQVLRTYAAPNYADHHQHGVRHHPHTDGTTRLRPVTSPPRYRDHLGQTDDRVLRPLQQTVVGNADMVHQELFLYDGHNSAHHQYAEGIPRGQVAQYLGHNPFQDGLSGFSESSYSDTQGGGNLRRPRERSAQQSFQSSHLNSLEDLQDQNTPSAEPCLVHSTCQEKPIDWGAHQRDCVLNEIRSWPGGSGGDLEALGEGFLRLPEDSDGITAMSVSYLHRNAGVAEPLSAVNQLPRSIVTQSHLLPVFAPSTFAQVVVDVAQAPLQVGRESESGLFDEPVPRSVGSLPALASSLALAEVIHLSSESPSKKLAFEKDMDDKAETGALNDLVPHLYSTASMRLGNTEAVNNSELRWAGLNDVDELRVDVLALHGSTNQDHFQQLSGSGIPQGQQSESSRGTRLGASEEVAQGLETDLNITTDDGCLKETESNSSDYDFHNLILTDGMSPPCAQISVSTDPTHILPPTGVSAGVMSSTIPTPSIMISTEISSLVIPSASNTSTCLGISNIEQEVNSMGSLLFKPGSLASRISEGDISDLLGQNVEFRRKDNNVFTSQFSARGDLAEVVASSVLVGPSREMVAPLPSANLQVDEKGNKWLPFSRDDTAVISPNLAHAPTFSASNWDRVQEVTDVNVEVDCRQTSTPDISVGNENLATKPPFTLAEELIAITSTEDGVAEAAVRTYEDLRQDSSSTGTAEDAEAEAIRSGLQTILNADLEEMRELGSGTFGTVYHGKWRGTDVAIKRIKASCFAGRPAERDRLIADFWREACTLSQLHHPNVVAFYGVVRDGPGGTLATVTEYMVNGSLKQVLQKKDRTIDRRKRLLIAMDAAFGMEYLHSKNIVHFDLKCDNLLVNMRDPHRPICKVGDLGLSKVKHQTMVSGGVRGTLPWMAPELLNGSSSLVTEKVDTFSFGIVMWELLTGEEPYANMHYGAIIGGIVNNTLRPSIPTWCDPLWKSLMERCWAAEPASRPSFSEVASELRVMATAQPKAHGDGQAVRCMAK